MKKLYSAENRLIAFNIKNLLEAENVECQVKNEFANGGVGDIAPIDTWVELWVDDELIQTAEKHLETILTQMKEVSSVEVECSNCHEINQIQFKICWNCQKPI